MYDHGTLPVDGIISSASNWDAVDVPTLPSRLSTDSSGQTFCMNFGAKVYVMNKPVYYRIKTIYSSDILPGSVQCKDIIPFDTTNAWVLGTDNHAYYNSDGFMGRCYAKSNVGFEKLIRTFNSRRVIGISSGAFADDSIYVSEMP
jgi:hypothetical protein